LNRDFIGWRHPNDEKFVKDSLASEHSVKIH